MSWSTHSRRPTTVPRGRRAPDEAAAGRRVLQSGSCSGDLLPHLQRVGLGPALNDPAILDPEDVDAGQPHVPVRGRDAELISLMRARGTPAEYCAIPRHHDVLVGDPEIGECGVVQVDDLMNALAAPPLTWLGIVVDDVRGE